jgi:hypothetical protein
VNRQSEAQGQEDQIAAYLDVVSRSLRAVPEEPKREFVREMRTHIETLVDQYQDEGRDEQTAVADALRMIGDPASVGRTWAAAWLRANEPGTFWAAFAIGIVSLLAIQGVNSLMQPLVAPLIMEANKAHSGIARVLFGPLGVWAVWGLSAPILAGAACGWFKPKRASAGLLATGALYGVCLVASLWRQAGAQGAAEITKNLGLSPGSIVFLLTATAIVSGVVMAISLILGSVAARSWRIRRLTQA